MTSTLVFQSASVQAEVTRNIVQQRTLNVNKPEFIKSSSVLFFSVVSLYMKKIFSILILFSSFNCFSQNQRKISTYIDFHVNTTIYDRTLTNNSAGFGAGLEVFMNTKSKFRPSLEIAGDAFGGTKELYLTSDGKPIYSKDAVSAILAGSSYQLSQKFYFNMAVGASFFNSSAYVTIKPAIGIYFPHKQQFVFKVSLTHIFQRDDISNQSFGFLNFGLGVRLF